MTQTILPIKFKKTDEKMTAHSGLLVLAEAMNAFGVEDALKERLPRPQSNRGNHPLTYIYATMLSMAGGGRTLEDIQKVLSDAVLRKSLNLTSFDASTQSKWLREKSPLVVPVIKKKDTPRC